MTNFSLHRFAASVLLSSIGLVGTAHAQSLVESDPPDQWGLGLGLGARRMPYTGAEDKKAALPLVTYESARFKLSGTTFDWKLARAGNVSFALRTRYDMRSGYEADDAPILSGMDERKTGFWVGGQMDWKTSFAKLSAEVTKATGNSKGSQFRLGIDRDFHAGSFVLTPRAELTWYDKKYVDYYYGVKASEATAARPFYEGGSASNLEIGLRTAYLIDRKQSVFLDVSTIKLGSKIKGSPIVDRSSLPALAVGYLYRF